MVFYMHFLVEDGSEFQICIPSACGWEEDYMYVTVSEGGGRGGQDVTEPRYNVTTDSALTAESTVPT